MEKKHLLQVKACLHWRKNIYNDNANCKVVPIFFYYYENKKVHTTTVTVMAQRNDIVGIVFRIIFPADECSKHWQPIGIHDALKNSGI